MSLTLYKFYVLSPTGKLLRRVEITAPDDEAAMRQARADESNVVTELWRGGELIRRTGR